MEQYISKSTLVAEIEKLKENARMSYSDYAEGRLDVCKELLSFISTLEVKEVDINKEISQFIDANFEKATIGHKLSLRRTGKYFFELGLQENKV